MSLGYFGCVRHYFGWVGVGGGAWGCMEHYVRYAGVTGVSGALFWLGGGGWE